MEGLKMTRLQLRQNVLRPHMTWKCAPTAYDVDKVVEQLKSETKRWQESGDEYADKKELGVAEGHKLALEIVKAGGVNG